MTFASLLSLLSNSVKEKGTVNISFPLSAADLTINSLIRHFVVVCFLRVARSPSSLAYGGKPHPDWSTIISARPWRKNLATYTCTHNYTHLSKDHTSNNKSIGFANLGNNAICIFHKDTSSDIEALRNFVKIEIWIFFFLINRGLLWIFFKSENLSPVRELAQHNLSIVILPWLSLVNIYNRFPFNDGSKCSRRYFPVHII